MSTSSLPVSARDARVWPRCHKCDTIWRQIGNRTGHCSKCHRTFDGATAFDRHQRHSDSGLVCLDPLDLITDGVPFKIRLGDGVFDQGVMYYGLEHGSLDGMLARLGRN